MRAAIGLVLLAACDPLAGTGYVGEPIFTLSGTFDVKSSTQDPGAGIALMWQDAAGANGPGVAATVVPVTVEVPASFRVSVPVLPPDASRFDLGDGAIAEAYVFLVADPSATPLVPRGVDRRHALVWTASDIADGTPTAAYLGGATTAGYHLRHFSSQPVPPPQQQALLSRCVTGGADPAACQARRAYALGTIADDDPLVIVVTGP